MGIAAILIGLPILIILVVFTFLEEEKKHIKMGYFYASVAVGVLVFSAIVLDATADYEVKKEEIITNKLEMSKDEVIKLDGPTRIIITTKKYPWYTELKSDKTTYQIKE